MSVWGIEFLPHPKQSLLRIYIDNPNGILVDDCVKVSHQITGVLSVEDPIPEHYHLEVSSPGADRLFFSTEQLSRYIGSTVQVKLYQSVAGRKKITGVIEKVNGDTVALREANELFEIPFGAMSKARLVPEYTINKGVRHGK